MAEANFKRSLHSIDQQSSKEIVYLSDECEFPSDDELNMSSSSDTSLSCDDESIASSTGSNTSLMDQDCFSSNDGTKWFELSQYSPSIDDSTLIEHTPKFNEESKSIESAKDMYLVNFGYY